MYSGTQEALINVVLAVLSLRWGAFSGIET